MIKNITTSGLLLAVILILFACDDPNKLGLDIQRDDQRISTFVTDTFTIESSVKLFDTLNTTLQGLAGRGQIGRLNDSKFGRISAMTFGNFLVPTSGIKFSDDQNRPAILDSLTLQLFVSSTQGDTSQLATINVHRLTQAMDATKANYYSRDNLPIGELLGSTRMKVKAGTTISIRLKDSFAREIIAKEGGDELKIQSAFDQFVKGIRISAEGIENLLFSFDPNDQGSITKLIFTYKNVATDASKTPALFFTSQSGSGTLFSNIQSDFSQTRDLKNLSVNNLVPTSRTNNQCYVAGALGITTLLKFPSLYGFSKNKDVIVNRAELIIEPTPDNFTTTLRNFPFPNLRFILATNDEQFDKINNQIYRYLLFEGSNDLRSTLTMNYLSNGRTYQPIIVTSYVQALMNKTVNNNSLFVITDRFFSSTETISFGDNKAAQNRMRLLVYYTVVTR